MSAFEKREQLMLLKSKLTLAEQSRLNGEPTVSLDDARERLDAKYNCKI